MVTRFIICFMTKYVGQFQQLYFLVKNSNHFHIENSRVNASVQSKNRLRVKEPILMRNQSAQQFTPELVDQIMRRKRNKVFEMIFFSPDFSKCNAISVSGVSQYQHFNSEEEENEEAVSWIAVSYLVDAELVN